MSQWAAELKTCLSWLLIDTLDSWHLTYSLHIAGRNGCGIGILKSWPGPWENACDSYHQCKHIYIHWFTCVLVMWMAIVGKPSIHRWCECLIITGNHLSVFGGTCMVPMALSMFWRGKLWISGDVPMFPIRAFLNFPSQPGREVVIWEVILFEGPINSLDISNISIHPHPNVNFAKHYTKKCKYETLTAKKSHQLISWTTILIFFNCEAVHHIQSLLAYLITIFPS